MGTWITLLLQLLQLIPKLLDLWNEKHIEKAKLKKEALNEVLSGLEESDTSRITMGFDLYNGVR